MLKTERTVLVALEEENIPTIKEWRSMESAHKSTREYRLLNTVSQKNQFRDMHLARQFTRIMFGISNKNKKLLGIAGLTSIDWKNRNSEISLYMPKRRWQSSKEAEDAIRMLEEYGFEELNLHRLYAEIEDLKENASLFTKTEFINEGRMKQRIKKGGQWQDTLIYSKLAEEYNVRSGAAKHMDSSAGVDYTKNLGVT